MEHDWNVVGRISRRRVMVEKVTHEDDHDPVNVLTCYDLIDWMRMMDLDLD